MANPMNHTLPKNALRTETADVLVVGSGIAGVVAAVSASQRAYEAGKPCKVMLVSYGEIFSGSSFSRDTWGLGLIAPVTASDEDVADLVDEICTVGGGVVDRSLVESFVQGIHPALERLQSQGVELLEPAHADEREFIPCFDSKHRLWRGFEAEAFKRALEPKLTEKAVVCRSLWELVDLLEASEDEDISRGEGAFEPRTQSRSQSQSQSQSGLPTISGALFFDYASASFVAVAAKAVVLATGGFANLFSRALGAPDNLATVQALAVRYGADLVNFEFMQIMPAMIGLGEGRVFNEKMLRFAVLDENQCCKLSVDKAHLESLLDERGGYGPFTSRLRSREFDFAMAATGDEGLALRFVVPDERLPEFAEHYFTWLEQTTGLTVQDSVHIVPYAHAANGGIKIGLNGETALPGLFAAGEVTGGMHGADRIGGLASANALVFGIRTGEAAADFALAKGCDNMQPVVWGYAAPSLSETQYQKLYQRLQATMTEHCMIIRSEEGLTQALNDLQRVEQDSQAHATSESFSPYGYLLYLRLQNQILSARLFVKAALGRRMSLGSHYRIDS